MQCVAGHVDLTTFEFFGHSASPIEKLGGTLDANPSAGRVG